MQVDASEGPVEQEISSLVDLLPAHLFSAVEGLDVKSLGKLAETCRLFFQLVCEDPQVDQICWRRQFEKRTFSGPGLSVRPSEFSFECSFRECTRRVALLDVSGRWKVEGSYHSSDAPELDQYSYVMRLSQVDKWVTGSVKRPWVFKISGRLDGNRILIQERGMDRETREHWTNICSATIDIFSGDDWDAAQKNLTGKAKEDRHSAVGGRGSRGQAGSFPSSSSVCSSSSSSVPYRAAAAAAAGVARGKARGGHWSCSEEVWGRDTKGMQMRGTWIQEVNGRVISSDERSGSFFASKLDSSNGEWDGESSEDSSDGMAYSLIMGNARRLQMLELAARVRDVLPSDREVGADPHTQQQEQQQEQEQQQTQSNAPPQNSNTGES
uniref:F-box domain-containing protein n=1 Tax=Chromera velia CCMP2878 TaxID=1169474 RepID=A0A0G4HD66_9ALVE|eukprot:Cvel_26406.t1-p1 / transcript=Cvel_26406.t1 / gene=Cvel_26406 / organism=Chromera_velia_CCMP2878 / gene_product=hypothetical protein / transcript_product=hypothetical protein / location=Cvel_scaffold3133:13888-17285(+) / protein_length=381 / sequence_SO=supercontig / SO=protein_coding / is_pseudo=false